MESVCRVEKENVWEFWFGAMSYTIIDKIIVSLKMDSLINNAIKGIILLIVIMVQIVGPQIKQKFKKTE